MTPANDETTCLGFADEAHYNVGRYHGVALVSICAADTQSLRAEMRAILEQSGAIECKWEKVRSAKNRFTAQKLVRWTLDHALSGTLHVNVLTWDTGTSEDQRQGTHHIRRLHSTYLHLFASVMLTRWPDARCWRFHPDQQEALNWQAVERELKSMTALDMTHTVEIDQILPRVSHEEPFVQIADLFAGLAVFSREGYDDYERWLCSPPEDHDEPAGEQDPPLRLSSSLRQRCLILDEFYTECKMRGVHVSLRTNRGLRTYDPQTPLAFDWVTLSPPN